MRICSEEKNEFIKTNSTNRDSFSRVHLLYIDSHNISSILPVYPEVKRIIVPDKLAVRANSVLKNVKIK